MFYISTIGQRRSCRQPHSEQTLSALQPMWSWILCSTMTLCSTHLTNINDALWNMDQANTMINNHWHQTSVTCEQYTIHVGRYSWTTYRHALTFSNYGKLVLCTWEKIFIYSRWTYVENHWFQICRYKSSRKWHCWWYKIIAGRNQPAYAYTDAVGHQLGQWWRWKSTWARWTSNHFTFKHGIFA